ncbi:DUF1850 domain-containing protein [Nonomuraea sp. PA05]|uniref:DUF1850 domain-containing protein n=1 Tax=Nonomuraea sp. PA05 TaxID=2604466 RepID=UPI001651B1A0|nr:DUF1850 domain-containing protein [Nonomuraea sp. PA05]
MALTLGSGDGAGCPAVNGLPVTRGFALAYVHSIYRAPAAEVFTVAGGRFTMRAVVSVNEGVLDYYAVEGQRVRLPGGLWLLRPAEPATYAELSLLTTSIGRRTVIADGRCLPLYPATGASEVRLSLALTRQPASRPCPRAFAALQPVLLLEHGVQSR